MQHRSPARSRRLARRSRRARAFAAGAIDRPSAAEPISGSTVDVAGWTWPFKDDRVRHVKLFVDGGPVGNARLTLRPDISEAFDMPEAVLSGFEAVIELAAEPTEHEIALSLEVHGLNGRVWAGPDWRLPVGPAGDEDEPREAGTAPTGHGAWPATAELDGPDRDWTRRRLGYDPSHVVVLVTDAALSAGPTIAALDVLAERWPSLELLVPGVRSDSYIANLMRRAARATGLEDRVTVPFVPAPASGWPALADVVLTTSMPGAAGDDLATLIGTLDAACTAAR